MPFDAEVGNIVGNAPYVALACQPVFIGVPVVLPSIPQEELLGTKVSLGAPWFSMAIHFRPLVRRTLPNPMFLQPIEVVVAIPASTTRLVGYKSLSLLYIPILALPAATVFTWNESLSVLTGEAI